MHGVGDGANVLRWELSTSDRRDCGAEQTADHTTSGRCPICTAHQKENRALFNFIWTLTHDQ